MVSPAVGVEVAAWLGIGELVSKERIVGSGLAFGWVVGLVEVFEHAAKNRRLRMIQLVRERSE